MRAFSCFVLITLAFGCTTSKPQGDLPTLYPTKGKVVRNGQVVTGGSLKFVTTPETPETRDLLIGAEINTNGTFELFTLHTLSQKRATGAPAGSYKVTFTSALGDQTQGGQVQVIELPTVQTLKAEPNELTLELVRAPTGGK